MISHKSRGPRRTDDPGRPTTEILSYWLRPKTTTTQPRHATKNHSPHFVPDCGHHGPRTRHVEELDGPVRYLCRRCVLSALAAEAQSANRAKVREQWDLLFVPGGLAATASLIGAARGMEVTI
jgi:hypothetical protein